MGSEESVNIGDRVMVLNNDMMCFIIAGDTGYVIKKACGSYSIRFDKNGEEWWFSGSNMRKI